MSEIKAASAEGRLLEIFGAGTAAVVCSVEKIGYKDDVINIATGEDGLGPITRTMLNEIVGRQTGKIESDWSVFVTKTK